MNEAPGEEEEYDHDHEEGEECAPGAVGGEAWEMGEVATLQQRKA